MKLEWLEWNRVERLINSLPEEARYLVMWERDGSRERLLAHLPLDEPSLRAFLDTCDRDALDLGFQSYTAESRQPVRRKSWRHRGRLEAIEPAASVSAGDAVVAIPPAAQSGARRENGSPIFRKQAIGAWVRSCVLRSMRDDAELIGFRLRVHGAGSKKIGSASFSVCNLTWFPADDDIPLHRRPVPSSGSADGGQDGRQSPATLGQSGESPAVAPGAVEAYEALGRYYAQAGQLWLDGYQSVLSTQVAIIQDSLERLRQSRQLEDQLRAQVVQLHLDQLQSSLAQSRDARDATMREALLLQAMAAFQELARAARASRAETERLAEVQALLDAAPGLMVLLQDPVLQPLLRDPRHAPMLAHALRAIVGQMGFQGGGPPSP